MDFEVFVDFTSICLYLQGKNRQKILENLRFSGIPQEFLIYRRFSRIFARFFILLNLVEFFKKFKFQINFRQKSALLAVCAKSALEKYNKTSDVSSIFQNVVKETSGKVTL